MSLLLVITRVSFRENLPLLTCLNFLSGFPLFPSVLCSHPVAIGQPEDEFVAPNDWHGADNTIHGDNHLSNVHLSECRQKAKKKVSEPLSLDNIDSPPLPVHVAKVMLIHVLPRKPMDICMAYKCVFPIFMRLPQQRRRRCHRQRPDGVADMDRLWPDTDVASICTEEAAEEEPGRVSVLVNSAADSSASVWLLRGDDVSLDLIISSRQLSTRSSRGLDNAVAVTEMERSRQRQACRK